MVCLHGLKCILLTESPALGAYGPRAGLSVSKICWRDRESNSLMLSRPCSYMYVSMVATDVVSVKVLKPGTPHAQ